jgi:hypothetical protein
MLFPETQTHQRWGKKLNLKVTISLFLLLHQIEACSFSQVFKIVALILGFGGGRAHGAPLSSVLF